MEQLEVFIEEGEDGKTLLGLVKRQMVILDEKMVGDLSSYLL